MNSAEARWSGEHSRQLDTYYGEMRGYIRREVIRENIQFQLHDFLKFPRRAIDINGSSGSDAHWLAGQHHDVVLVDSDEAALAEAAQHKYPVLEDILSGTAQTALAKYGPESFDLVLSHGFLMYSDSPLAETKRLAQLVSHGGYLSLATAGLYGKINREKSKGNGANLQQLLLTRKYVNNIGLSAAAYLPPEIEGFLTKAGLETVGWFGVRVGQASDNDTRKVEEVPVFHRNRAVDDELFLSRDPTQKPQGQLLHFIARKIA